MGEADIDESVEVAKDVELEAPVMPVIERYKG